VSDCGTIVPNDSHKARAASIIRKLAEIAGEKISEGTATELIPEFFTELETGGPQEMKRDG
jgi:hypothetical protein